MRRTHVILLSTAVLAAAAVILAGAGDGPLPPAATGGQELLDEGEAAQEVVPTAGREVAAPREETATASRPRSPELLLPDGTTVPSLNGAVGAAPLARAWSPHVPYSPIVGIERSDAGVDWYVHADGTRSTTEMKYRPDLGREDAVTRVAHPGPLPPRVER